MAGIRWAMKLLPPSMVPSMKRGLMPRYSITGIGHMVLNTLAVHRPSMSCIVSRHRPRRAWAASASSSTSL
jgi:hypothetical protein